MKRIALISYHSPPILSAESILVGKVVPYLANDFQIDVITAADDPDFREDMALGSLLKHSNVRVFAYSTHRSKQKIVRKVKDRLLSKIGADRYGPWIREVLRKHDWTRGYQALYSRSQPGASHIVAREAKSRLGIPWLASFSDPWAYNPYHPGNEQVKKQENSVVSAADQLIFPTVEIMELMQQHYPELRGSIVPHCFEPSLYPSAAPSNKKRPEQLTIAYIGDFYGLRSPEPLCQALAGLAAQNRQLAEKLVLTIVGNIESKFRGAVEEFRGNWPGEVRITGQVPYLESLDWMKNADLLVLVDAPGTVNLFLPSKLIDYFGARRPILGITPLEGTTANLLSKFGHATSAPENTEAIQGAFTQLLCDMEAEQQRVDALNYEEFTAEHIAGRLRGFLTNLIG